jgi:hypothetical protein
MLYVLASDQRWLYHYTPGDQPGHHCIGHDEYVFAEGRMAERPEGSLVIVFEKAADAYQFIFHYRLPGEAAPGRVFNPSPAQTGDNLGPRVCLATPHGKGDDFTFTIQPTPADATEAS